MNSCRLDSRDVPLTMNSCRLDSRDIRRSSPGTDAATWGYAWGRTWGYAGGGRGSVRAMVRAVLDRGSEMAVPPGQAWWHQAVACMRAHRGQAQHAFRAGGGLHLKRGRDAAWRQDSRLERQSPCLAASRTFRPRRNLPAEPGCPRLRGCGASSFAMTRHLDTRIDNQAVDMWVCPVWLPGGFPGVPSSSGRGRRFCRVRCPHGA